ncbi:hypothetical protein RIR_e535_A0A2I1EYY8_9GLOM [Rhizophagus irregularis DAOM 181602=DAOM 197198]|nr:hypothetical protein RIR_e535_A0A2I1EYY8_9GLOM [Rhizophagus irregularis DAOM 181602=DAOM 197198]
MIVRGYLVHYQIMVYININIKETEYELNSVIIRVKLRFGLFCGNFIVY